MTTAEEKQDKICFVVSAIGEPKSQTRSRADEVLNYIIKPAVEECGYKAIRADAIAEPGVITTDMINNLLETPLVIADLTERNPNVYYEVGVRHAFHKPIILISEEADIPFDLQMVRYIHFNHTSLTSANACKVQIADQIKAIDADPKKLANPISQVATLQALEKSDKPVERAMGDLQSQMRTLNIQMRQMVNILKYSELTQLSPLLESAKENEVNDICRLLIQYPSAYLNTKADIKQLIESIYTYQKINEGAVGKLKELHIQTQKQRNNPIESKKAIEDNNQVSDNN